MLVKTETIPDEVVVTAMGDGVRVTTVSEALRVPVNVTSTVRGQESLTVWNHVVTQVLYTVDCPRVTQRCSVVVSVKVAVYVLVSGGRVTVV